jgi:o-succinylbenzoate synthase
MTCMRIEAAELWVVRMPLRFRFETSFGVQTDRLVPIVVLHGAGAIGVAEGVMDSHLPLYREETVAGALPLLRDLLATRVVGHEFASPGDVESAIGFVRGNRMARAAIEMAAWDLHARQLGVPLRDLLGGTGGAVACGVSLGIQPTVDATVDVVARHVDQGYRRIKLKIKPGWDLDVLRAVRTAFPAIVMTADANSAYTLDDARHLCRFDEIGLDYVEQPLGWDDIDDHAALARQMATPLCLDESISHHRDAARALAIGAAQVINVKAGRIGGHGEVRRVDAAVCAAGGASWCGGMLETGIGRAHNTHLATLPSFTKPGDISSASRYWQTDLVEEPLECIDGMMPVPSGAGIGVTLDRVAMARFAVSSEEISPA